MMSVNIGLKECVCQMVHWYEMNPNFQYSYKIVPVQFQCWCDQDIFSQLGFRLTISQIIQIHCEDECCGEQLGAHQVEGGGARLASEGDQPDGEVEEVLLLPCWDPRQSTQVFV